MCNSFFEALTYFFGVFFGKCTIIQGFFYNSYLFLTGGQIRNLIWMPNLEFQFFTAFVFCLPVCMIALTEQKYDSDTTNDNAKIEANKCHLVQGYL